MTIESPPAVKERGTIFSAPMVQALLARRKTQTRRIIRPEPNVILDADWSGGGYLKFQCGNLALKPISVNASDYCPYGRVGDRLWVRETWAVAGSPGEWPCDKRYILYRQDYPENVWSEFENIPPASEVKWKNSIFMPRWASRIALEITDVRVQRLMEISEEDAIAEGIEQPFIDIGPRMSHHDQREAWREAFGKTWQSIHGPDSWNDNPFIWALTFKRIDPAPHP